MTVPSIQPLVAKWAPVGERSSIATFIFSGAQMGTVLSIPCGGLLADSLGWQSVFYIEGSLVVFLVGAWLYVVYDSPEQHPRICAKEKSYIMESTVKPASKVEMNLNSRFLKRNVLRHAVGSWSKRASRYPGNRSQLPFLVGRCWWPH